MNLIFYAVILGLLFAIATGLNYIPRRVGSIHRQARELAGIAADWRTEALRLREANAALQRELDALRGGQHPAMAHALGNAPTIFEQARRQAEVMRMSGVRGNEVPTFQPEGKDQTPAEKEE